MLTTTPHLPVPATKDTSPPSAVHEVATDAGSSRIALIVDDTEANRQLVGYWLRQSGFQVMEAATGSEGLALIKDASPDLIVLDVVLPDIHGFEVCRRIKANPTTASVPVLQTSALMIDPRSRAQGLDEGADAYMPHPLEFVEFMATVRALLRAHERTVDPPMAVASTASNGLANQVAALRAAIRRNALELRYEPIVSMTERTVVGVEALVQWERPAGRMLSEDVHRLAGEADLGDELTDWMVSQACRRSTSLHSGGAGDGLTTAIQVSAGPSSEGLARMIHRRAAEAEVDPRGIVVHLPIAGFRRIRPDALDGLQPAQVRVKIDSAFVARLVSSPIDRELLRAIVVRARALGVSVTAEGVEREEQLAALIGLGCDFGSGRFLGTSQP